MIIPHVRQFAFGRWRIRWKRQHPGDASLSNLAVVEHRTRRVAVLAVAAAAEVMQLEEHVVAGREQRLVRLEIRESRRGAEQRRASTHFGRVQKRLEEVLQQVVRAEQERARDAKLLLWRRPIEDRARAKREERRRECQVSRVAFDERRTTNDERPITPNLRPGSTATCGSRRLPRRTSPA